MIKANLNLKNNKAIIKFITQIKDLFNNLLKTKCFKLVFLIFSLILCIYLSFILLILSIRIYFNTIFFLPYLIGGLTFTFFLIPICLYFLKNLDLFEYFLKKVITLIIKPWILPLTIIFFSFGFYIIYVLFKLPNIFYFFAILPVIPLYIIQITFKLLPNATKYDNEVWAGIFCFLLIIPLILYIFHRICKKNFLKIKLLNKHNLKKNLIKRTSFNFPTKFDNYFKKKIIILWLIVFLISFLILININIGFDTPYYYLFVKDYLETGNFDLIIRPETKSNPHTDIYFYQTFSAIPIIILLLLFTLICGGNIGLGATVMISLMYSITIPLIILITKNLTNDNRISIWSGFFLSLSSPFQVLLIGILKQLLSIDLLLLSFYLISINYKIKWSKMIFNCIAIIILLLQSIIYEMFTGLIFLIITLYFLKEKHINFFFLKSSQIYKYAKILLFVLLGFLLLFFCMFGFIIPYSESLFKTPLVIFNVIILEFFAGQSFSNMIYSGLFFVYLGIVSIFIIIGLYIDFNIKVIKNRKIKFFLTSILEITLIILLISLFGFRFLPNRMIIFIPIPGSIFSAIAINKLKLIFPRIFIKNPKFPKLIKISIVFSMLIVFLLGIPNIRNSSVLQEEVDSFYWFKTRPDYDKLTNENTSDIHIICNPHLIKWAKYYIHYNIQHNYYGGNHLDLLKIDDLDLEQFREKAKEKLYILISSYSEYFGETWTMDGLIEFFEEYRTYYDFQWNNYTINKIVTIWEIIYI